MNEPPSTTLQPLWAAIAFAARAHRHQIRKDGQTPYVSHPFRVCLIIRHVFGIDDARILTTAVLHDTIEDTATDCDDLIEQFGAEVANWVGVLSKDKRLPEDEREPAFIAAFCAGGPAVHLIKLADLYDNIQDSQHFPAPKRRTSLQRYASYLDALEPHMTAETRPAFEIVRKLFDDVRLADSSLRTK